MANAVYDHLQGMLSQEQRTQLGVVREFLLQDPAGLDKAHDAPAPEENANG